MKFIIDNMLAISIAVATGLALLLPSLMPRGKRASPTQVVQMINRGKTVLVDVRTPEEFAGGHLRDAKNIPLADFGTRIAELDKSKGKTIVVVCQSGARVDKAIKLLAGAGFDDVVGLDGGLTAWTAANLPTAK